MSNSISIKTFLLFLFSQTATISLSLWFRSLGWYGFALLTIIIPLAIISIIWPIYLRSDVEAVVLRDVFSTLIAGASSLVVSNVVVYLIFIYIRDRDLSNSWGKDFDVLKIELFCYVAIFFVLYLLSYLVVSKKVLEMLQRD